MNTPLPNEPEHLMGEEFVSRGVDALRLVAAYWAGLQGPDAPPVLAQCKPGETLAMVPERAPERGEAWADVLSDVARIVMPNLTHWQAPGFFAYFPANTSGPSVLADVLCAGFGVQGMLWATSPAATELETRMLDWLREALGLGDRFASTSERGGGVIQGTASEATLVALCAARTRARARNPGHGPLMAYTSTQGHSSIVKAAMIAGVAANATAHDGVVGGLAGGGGVRLIGVDAGLRMDVGALAKAIEEDARAGRCPFFVTATIGTTGTGAVDDVGAIAAVCARHNVWLHVDGAFAGAALICPELRAGLGAAGLDGADSISFNPHKWLLTGFDCNVFYTADRRALIDALSITPEYLRNTASEGGEVIDYRDWQVPLGRRFRALKLWFVMRHYGLEGLRAHLREHVRLGEMFEGLVSSDSRFEAAVARSLSLVCFRLRGPGGGPADVQATNAANRALMDRLNAGGKVYLTHTVLPDGRFVLRMAIGGTFTRDEHVREAWELISQSA